ncbi:MAG: alpha-amylase [Bacteroidetes bacterium 4484_276]|nr:MAG: alpha-amylase [Bacteroidetes bacterium 4484_276]OYT13534.1 MAG: alpha-amylase [Bacteroidetes bacterium 4572_114]
MKKLIFTIVALAILFVGCVNTSDDQEKNGQTKKSNNLVSKVKHPEWSKNATIYEVNLRQFTNEGTILAFMKQMPRLRNMGVDILWFMPIHPIGKKNRKGTLGSYYSVQDYEAVSHEFGYIDEFTKMVELAHILGMKVIIDWVANHSAWDHAWVTQHPEWYDKGPDGKMYSPFDWSDVVQLDYDNQDLRRAMIKAMKYWLVEANIDGFRCDVAGMVPTDFWDEARIELDKIKPVFMLAESEEDELLIDAFDMDYGWGLHHISNLIARGDTTANALERYFNNLKTHFPKGAYKMNFTSNHDENSWNGTVHERYGAGYKTFAVLMATVPGMPLIYTGQESGLDKRLDFFEKDIVEWADYPLQDFYRILLNTKKANKALWNGDFGGGLKRVETNNDEAVFLFTRQKEGDAIFVILNLTGTKQDITLLGNDYIGTYSNIFDKEKVTFIEGHELQLGPWEFRVYEK